MDYAGRRKIGVRHREEKGRVRPPCNLKLTFMSCIWKYVLCTSSPQTYGLWYFWSALQKRYYFDKSVYSWQMLWHSNSENVWNGPKSISIYIQWGGVLTVYIVLLIYIYIHTELFSIQRACRSIDFPKSLTAILHFTKDTPGAFTSKFWFIETA